MHKESTKKVWVHAQVGLCWRPIDGTMRQTSVHPRVCGDGRRRSHPIGVVTMTQAMNTLTTPTSPAKGKPRKPRKPPSAPAFTSAQLASLWESAQTARTKLYRACGLAESRLVPVACRSDSDWQAQLARLTSWRTSMKSALDALQTAGTSHPGVSIRLVDDAGLPLASANGASLASAILRDSTRILRATVAK